MKKGKVIVKGDTLGNVIIPTANPEYGYVRVQQIRRIIDSTGFAKRQPVSALIQGTIETLKDFDYKLNQELEGTIIFREQLTPFNKKDPAKNYKYAGNTKVICKVGDLPIYRKSFYVDDPESKDVLVEHTNKEEIRAAIRILTDQQQEEETL